MNTNLKSGLTTLAIFASSAAVVGGTIYGIGKSLQPKKPDIMVTDPQKADQAIRTESNTSRAFFEATQNMQSENTQNVQEMEPVKDITELCRNIAAYQQLNNEIIRDLKNGKKSEAEYKITTARRMEQKIRKDLDEAGYLKPNSSNYIDNLGNTFETYDEKTKAEIEALK